MKYLIKFIALTSIVLTQTVNGVTIRTFITDVCHANAPRKSKGSYEIIILQNSVLPFRTNDGTLVFSDDFRQTIWDVSEQYKIIIPQKYLGLPEADEPKEPQTSGNQTVDTCIICAIDKEAGNTLRCGHKFCTRCLATMYAYNKTKCPLCAQEMFPNRKLMRKIKSRKYLKKLCSEAQDAGIIEASEMFADDEEIALRLQEEFDQQQEAEDEAYRNRQWHNRRYALDDEIGIRLLFEQATNDEDDYEPQEPDDE